MGTKKEDLINKLKGALFFKKNNQPDKPTLLKWGKKKAKLLIKVTHVRNKRGKPQSFAVPWTWHSTTRLGWYTEHTSERLNQQFFMIQINLIFCTSSPLFPVASPSWNYHTTDAHQLKTEVKKFSLSTACRLTKLNLFFYLPMFI